MKLVIGGATGFTGAETLRQAVRLEAITSIVAIGRKSYKALEGSGASKIHNIVLEDFLKYPEDARKQLVDADACIWTVAITPSKSKDVPWEEVKKVCRDYAIAALKTMVEVRTAPQPLRFIYYSGSAAQRDQTKTPPIMAEMLLMRGQVENELLAYAAETKGAAQVCCVKPGLIMGPDFDEIRFLNTSPHASGIPKIKLEECVAATLKQAIEGIQKEPILNDELAEIGRAYLARIP